MREGTYGPGGIADFFISFFLLTFSFSFLSLVPYPLYRFYTDLNALSLRQSAACSLAGSAPVWLSKNSWNLRIFCSSSKSVRQCFIELCSTVIWWQQRCVLGPYWDMWKWGTDFLWYLTSTRICTAYYQVLYSVSLIYTNILQLCDLVSQHYPWRHIVDNHDF